MACAFGCAGMRGPAERTYRRAEADSVPLHALELVVVTAGPPRIAGPVFEVKTFEPPQEDAPLRLGPEDPSTQKALVEALERRLRAAGFSLVVRTAPPIGDTATGTTTATGARTSTSTLGASGTSTRALPLTPDATLGELLEHSSADAVLVVRAVPVDGFVIDFGAGTRVERTALGKETIRDWRPVNKEGRLLVGQAFLFDRRSRLRLWTKQAPDYPEDGRLVPTHPFLRYGYVHDGPGPAPPDDERARLASARFVESMFGDFPST
jgi:hypothetical protein